MIVKNLVEVEIKMNISRDTCREPTVARNDIYVDKVDGIVLRITSQLYQILYTSY